MNLSEKQTKWKKKFLMKSLNCFYPLVAPERLQNWKSNGCSKQTLMMGENEEKFSYLFKIGKIRKILHFPPSSTSAFSFNFGGFGATTDEQHSNFLLFWTKFEFVCFPPIYALFNPKRLLFFLKKGGEKGRKHTNSQNNLGNRQTENFCLTYFSKLNRKPNRKKVIPFWRLPIVTRVVKILPKISENPTYISFRWVLIWRFFQKPTNLYWSSQFDSKNKLLSAF